MGVRRLVSGALLATLVMGFLTVAAPSAFALTGSEQQFVTKINAERTKRGLKALVVKSDLVAVARRHSDRMAAEGRIWHNPNLANEVSGWQVIGENVGMGPSVDSLHAAFMNSPSHKDNILYSAYNQIGVGNEITSDGTIYTTHVFAKRGSSTTTAPKTVTSSKPKSSTAASSSSSSAPSVQSAPAPKPKPKPKPVRPQSRTVELLVRMVGMDAEVVDPATGIAAGG